MVDVRSFCLYCGRTKPERFVPDLSSIHSYHGRIRPYISSQSEFAQFMRAASNLERRKSV
jgi:hypothetical protein